jgi:hypothetical protein
MGTRLYPNTKNVSSLEILAKVPEGTFTRLAEVQERHKKELSGVPHQSRYELEYKQWGEINDDPHLGALDTFLTFGWGKFDPCGYAEDYAGHLDNLVQCAIVLRGNGIYLSKEHLALTEGLHWC